MYRGVCGMSGGDEVRKTLLLMNSDNQVNRSTALASFRFSGGTYRGGAPRQLGGGAERRGPGNERVLTWDQNNNNRDGSEEPTFKPLSVYNIHIPLN